LPPLDLLAMALLSSLGKPLAAVQVLEVVLLGAVGISLDVGRRVAVGLQAVARRRDDRAVPAGTRLPSVSTVVAVDDLTSGVVRIGGRAHARDVLVGSVRRALFADPRDRVGGQGLCPPDGGPSLSYGPDFTHAASVLSNRFPHS
jgi:hypothetical protein